MDVFISVFLLFRRSCKKIRMRKLKFEASDKSCKFVWGESL